MADSSALFYNLSAKHSNPGVAGGTEERERSIGLQGLLRDARGQEGCAPRRTSRRRTGSWRASSTRTSTRTRRRRGQVQGGRRGLRGPEGPGQAPEVRPVRVRLEPRPGGAAAGLGERTSAAGRGFDFRASTSAAWAAARGFSSFFEMLFGGARPAAAAGARGAAGGGQPASAAAWAARPAATPRRTISLTVEEAVRGGAREIAIADPATGQRKDLVGEDPERGAAAARRSAWPARGSPGSAAAGRRPPPEGGDRARLPLPDRGLGHPHHRAGDPLGGGAGRRGGGRDPHRAGAGADPGGLLLGPEDPAARHGARAVRRRQRGISWRRSASWSPEQLSRPRARAVRAAGGGLEFRPKAAQEQFTDR